MPTVHLSSAIVLFVTFTAFPAIVGDSSLLFFVEKYKKTMNVYRKCAHVHNLCVHCTVARHSFFLSRPSPFLPGSETAVSLFLLNNTKMQCKFTGNVHTFTISAYIARRSAVVLFVTFLAFPAMVADSRLLFCWKIPKRQ